MTKKKRKRSDGVMRKGLKGLFIIIALVLGSLFVFVLSRYISSPKGAASPPLYEEIYAITSDLNHEINRIDTILYEALYHYHIPDDDIFFTEVRPKHRSGQSWDFVEQLIKLPNNNVAQQLRKRIEVDLSRLGPSISYKVTDSPEKEVVYHIFALGFHTHKIRFIKARPKRKLHKNLPKITIIIDDLGYDRDIALSFMELGLPISFSILP
ncbi:hypothetical protein ACFL9T_23790, partial [Thermodesulfobacteriota bacterium]